MNYYSTGFDFKICLLAQKVTGPFRRRGPGKEVIHKMSQQLK